MQIGRRFAMPKLTPADELATVDPATMGRDWGPQAAEGPGRVALERGADPMARAPEAWEPNVIQRLGGILGGVDKQTMQADHSAREIAMREAQDRAGLVGGLSDRERLAYYANPEQWGGRVSENVGAHQVQAGNTLVRPGFGITVAPKLTEDGGVFGTQTPGGWKQTGARGLGAPEVADLAVASDRSDLERDKLAALTDYRGGQLGIAGQRVAIAKAKAGGKPGASMAGLGMPTGYRRKTPQQ
jgi:hypothetical protein